MASTRTIRQISSADARRLADELIALVDRHHLSVAHAARGTGLPLEGAGMLLRLKAIEREAAETELEERLDDIERQCPGEDWWSYSDRQRARIVQGSSIPNRIVRELVVQWQRRTGQPTGSLAASLGITDEALRRSLGMVVTPGRTKGGRRYPRRLTKTITIETASRIVRALGIPPCEVPGL